MSLKKKLTLSTLIAVSVFTLPACGDNAESGEGSVDVCGEYSDFVQNWIPLADDLFADPANLPSETEVANVTVRYREVANSLKEEYPEVSTYIVMLANHYDNLAKDPRSTENEKQVSELFRKWDEVNPQVQELDEKCGVLSKPEEAPPAE